MSELASNIVNRRARPVAETVISLGELPGFEIFEEQFFQRMLYIERKRAERSKRRFVLMLLESGSLIKAAHQPESLGRVMGALSHSTRETDIKGWYKDGSVLGVIFTEIGGAEEGKAVAKAILGRITSALAESLSIDELNEIRLSFRVFPEDQSPHDCGGPSDATLYPELTESKRLSRAVKRGMDIGGSLCALTASLPALLVISIAIKLTSKGPIFFRQERIGQHGRKFKMLKFRSMYSGNNPTIHEEYVKRLIAGERDVAQSSGGQKTFKLTNDPRVTPFGRFLRRSSLDELPQFLNVLKGEMSIVGPRPPIPYEFSQYQTWHAARLVAVRPGITGLWQVRGRSRVEFDDMVRMDLQYAGTWSPWMDLKIMLCTPLAMLFGSGAY